MYQPGAAIPFHRGAAPCARGGKSRGGIAAPRTSTTVGSEVGKGLERTAHCNRFLGVTNGGKHGLSGGVAQGMLQRLRMTWYTACNDIRARGLHGHASQSRGDHEVYTVLVAVALEVQLAVFAALLVALIVLPMVFEDPLEALVALL
eukprot:1976462-Pyramimonas_sp.AAC.1